MLAWSRREGVAEQIKPEWGPLVLEIKMQGSGQTVASVRPRTGWKIKESALQQFLPQARAKLLREHLEEVS